MPVFDSETFNALQSLFLISGMTLALLIAWRGFNVR